VARIRIHLSPSTFTGITNQIDEKLKLTATAKELTAKVDEVKGSVSTKLTDLKSKADAPAAKSD